FSDSSLSLSFLRTTPAKNPRTECCCQPVHCMMLAIVAPPGRLSKPSTRACFEFARVGAGFPVLREVPFARALDEDRIFLLRGGLLLDMSNSSRSCRRNSAPPPPKPRGGPGGAGGGEER